MSLYEGIPEEYPVFLAGLKVRIREAQTRAVLSANRELILLYWHIGKEIVQRQEREGWGAKVIDRLSADLKREFPDMKGFSSRNLKYMRSFARAYPDEEFVQEVLAQITWYHTVTLLDKVKDPVQREWYIRRTIANGWSRNVLVHQIERGLIRREGRAVTNFSETLPAEQSDLALQTMKDPYIFDFLRMGETVRERELERGLIDHLREFLLELGVGFAFVGSQYRLAVGGQDFYLDLLFYHLRLRSYVVIDLKVGEFIPEYAGKMNFYLSAVDDLLAHSSDNPSIGIVLCKAKNRVIAEYALRDMARPIGVAGYVLTSSLPEELAGRLPTVDELEEELERGEG
ncbi:PDDEXK nuclease domain-containing protein [Methanofollis aquaemaris]|nr:PDDEXK nuclease domain-containing protein [Methanofollis aquaemaris]